MQPESCNNNYMQNSSPPSYNDAIRSPYPGSPQQTTLKYGSGNFAMVIPFMGRESSSCTCQNCGAYIMTKIEGKVSLKTHLCALLFYLVGAWPFVIVPYCVDSFKTITHYCPECNAYIGSSYN